MSTLDGGTLGSGTLDDPLAGFPAAKAKTPHFRTPFQIVGGSPAEVEQDSGREIDQCIEAVLRTPVGTRIEDPEFGRPDETFRLLGPNPSAEAYLSVVEEDEPRARVRGAARVQEIAEESVKVEREAEHV